MMNTSKATQSEYAKLAYDKDKFLSENGFQRVPSHILKECECRDCRGEFQNRVLFTQENLKEPVHSSVAYSKWVDRIRMNSYCRFHAVKLVEP